MATTLKTFGRGRWNGNPDNLPQSDASKMSFGTDAFGRTRQAESLEGNLGLRPGPSASIGKVVPAAELIARFKKEYSEAVDPAL